MNPISIFTDIADFRAYTEGLQADTVLDQLKPSVRTVAGDIKALITPAAFDAIAAITAQAPAAQQEAKDLLKTALANGSMFKYQIFASAKKNGSEDSLYKYQHEEIKEHYIEAYCRAMDELLDWLDANDTADYHNSDSYKVRQALPLKNAREFNEYYGIGNSSFFYHKALFLIRSNWTYKVRPLLARDDSRNTDEVMELAKHILAYRVMAEAVLQFDKSELPRSIHWDFNHEYTKDSEMQSRERLASQLLSKVDSWEGTLAVLMKSSQSAALSSDENSEGNKFYVVL